MNLDLICKNCGHRIVNPKVTDYRYEDGDDQRHFPFCPICNEIMCNECRINVSQNEYCHISDSLAMHPDQIPEHRKLFPDVEVLSDGRPKFTSVKQQSTYLDKIGMYKQPQKLKGIAKLKSRKKTSKAASV